MRASSTAPAASQESRGRIPRRRVLIVDDDELILSSLGALFRFETDYEIHVEKSASKAVGLLSAKPFDVIVSDFLMPEMDGIELLEIAGRLYPRAALILLTGYAGGRRTRRVARGLGLHYLEKPWSNSALLKIAESGMPERSGEPPP